MPNQKKKGKKNTLIMTKCKKNSNFLMYSILMLFSWHLFCRFTEPNGTKNTVTKTFY